MAVTVDKNNSHGALSDCRFLDLPQFTDDRGSLTFVEQNDHVPFNIKRIYYLYDVPADKSRGNHAHQELEQVMIAANGSFDVKLDDGYRRETIRLDNPSEGLYIPQMVWRTLENFTDGAVALNITARYYDEDDYIHEYEEFERLARSE
jgi:dTDP-4-dehydrorhamnose 3,5-epimerase-like enzyme